ncbi:MAG: RnfABCDGE type electron transport complex subunit G [Clostridia bacterium]|nr:RnfABCDGE type electron transport complex subunit G [Clostridia bacterium]MBQ4542984.1 RnfABCDGE type electron transport complex subunit G [Clostridia bacterium]
MQKNENPVVLSLVLLVISLVVALLLAFTNTITREKIAENTLNEQKQARREVLSGASEFVYVNYRKGNVESVFEGRSGTDIVGWCVNITPSGYGGEIDLMVGISSDMKVSGIKVVSNSETAGLGAKCADREFSGQFAKKTAPVSVIKNGTPESNEIVAITGATVTSEAVTKGVNEAVAAIEEINELLGGVVDE